MFGATVRKDRITAQGNPLKPAVSIIIVNWNGRSHLTDCLDSLAAQTFRDFEVVMIDNGSVDDSVAFVQAQYPWVKLVLQTENSGFATGNNRGFEQAAGEYIVTLNNDTRVATDWLERLVNVAVSNPRAGMVGSRICSFFEPDVIDSLGMGICADGMSRGRYRNRRWSELSLPEIVPILFPSACAALYRRAMIEQIGFFDDDFFAYAEDSDLGLRGRLAGWEALLASGAVVYHKYSQSSGSLSPLKVYYVERNHYWAALKNFPPGRLLALPYFTLLRYVVQLKVVACGVGTGGEFRAGGSQRAIVKALLRASFDSIIGVPQVLSKRNRLMRTRRLSWRQFSRLLKHHRISFKELLDSD